MTAAPETPREAPRHRRGRWIALALLLLLLALLLLLRSCAGSPWGSARGGDSTADSLRRADSLRLDSLRLDSLRHLDSLALAARNDSLLRGLSRADSLALLDSLRKADSLATWRRRQALWAASHAKGADSSKANHPASAGATGLSRRDSLRRLTGDSLGPVVFADPAPGVHSAPVDVALIVMESKGVPLCGPRPDSLRVCRDLIRVTGSTRLWISAEDSIGNRAEPREMRWRIDPDASRCGPRRALVPQDDAHDICVDAYEYPNDPSQLPRTSTNWEEASALCAKAGRRLCTADELKGACTGPEDWSYPYGSTFAVSYCQVSENKLARGVGRPACRSWWGAYNLVGNAWEWTATPITTGTGSTYLTSGGTFEGGPEVRCGKTSKSFFRQNRYEAVGFRCCETLPSPP